MIRGGSWRNDSQNCRSANRNANEPSNRNDNLGFRVAAAPRASGQCPAERNRPRSSPAPGRANPNPGRPVPVAQRRTLAAALFSGPTFDAKPALLRQIFARQRRRHSFPFPPVPDGRLKPALARATIFVGWFAEDEGGCFHAGSVDPCVRFFAR
ncbi:MAG: hypothetical protein KJ000_36235 [Pirellulaceae bacterium]|nr:hypothetical protein [Pirellulaceae bacterium]